jgi:hypothetical protein
MTQQEAAQELAKEAARRGLEPLMVTDGPAIEFSPGLAVQRFAERQPDGSIKERRLSVMLTDADWEAGG